MRKHKWLLWDLDNTLLDFSAAAHLSFIDMMKAFDLPFDEEHYALYQDINHGLWNTLENGGISQSEIKTKRWEVYFSRISTFRDPDQANQAFFKGLAKHPVEVDGARQLLEDVQGHFDCCLVTNGIGEIQRKRLESSGFGQYFTKLVISDEIQVAKPNKAFFDYTFKTIDKPSKDSAIIIGDNIGSDIRGGVDYGIDACWYNPSEKKSFGGVEATHTIKHLDDFRGIIGL